MMKTTADNRERDPSPSPTHPLTSLSAARAEEGREASPSPVDPRKPSSALGAQKERAASPSPSESSSARERVGESSNFRGPGEGTPGLKCAPDTLDPGNSNAPSPALADSGTLSRTAAARLGEGARPCSPQLALDLLTRNPAARLVDVREYAEFAHVHARGASLIPLGTLDARAAELDPAKPVVLICKSGKRAAQAGEILAAAGFRDLHVVDGGTDAWVAANLPTDKVARAPWALERQVRLVAGALVLAGLFIPPWPWLSAFVGAGLVFAALTNTCGMAMLLAKMPWNQDPARADEQKSCCER